MTCTVRPATADDIQFLDRALRQLYHHVQQTSVDPYLAQLDPGFEAGFAPWFERMLDNADCQILLAVQARMPVGFIVGVLVAPFVRASRIKTIGQIELCWVQPAQRRTGIARALLAELEAWFRSRDVAYIDLQYLLGNTEAEQAWQHLGYRPYRVSARKRLDTDGT